MHFQYLIHIYILIEIEYKSFRKTNAKYQFKIYNIYIQKFWSIIYLKIFCILIRILKVMNKYYLEYVYLWSTRHKLLSPQSALSYSSSNERKFGNLQIYMNREKFVPSRLGFKDDKYIFLFFCLTSHDGNRKLIKRFFFFQIH